MLRFIFCPNKLFDEEIYRYTKKLITAKVITAQLDEKYSPNKLVQQLHTLIPEITPVVVLCDKYDGHLEYQGQVLALEARGASRNAYLIYISNDYNDLKKLTNNNLRISGYMLYNAGISQYHSIVGNIWLDYTSQSIPEDEKFTLVIGKKVQTFLIRDIIYFESLDKKIYINTITSRVDTRIGFYGSLSDLQARLKHAFIRCHNSFLVNARHIKKISLKDHEMTLTYNIIVNISDTYKSNILELIARYNYEAQNK